MVYLHFPSKLTDEEVMLQNKYAKLRKKKKALEDLRAAKKKPEPEKVNPLKRALDPKEAKEHAKKLLAAGKVSIPARANVEKTFFKRSRILERKINATPRPGGDSTPARTPNYDFYPIPPTPGFSEPPPTPSPSLDSSSIQFEPFTPAPETPSSPNSSQFFSPTKPYSPSPRLERQYRGGGGGHKDPRESDSHGGSLNPKRGQTIYVNGHELSEEFLRTTFGKFGKLINIKMGSASTGFVTFEKVEVAEIAITEMNGSTVEDKTLLVEFARKQPSIHSLINDASASATWSSLASSQSMKGSHSDKREAVVYDEI